MICAATPLMQTTIHQSVHIQGKGIHTGTLSDVMLKPAPVNTGIQFIMHMDHATHLIPAHVDHVSATAFCTHLRTTQAHVQTVEHVLSAVNAMGVSNLEIHVSGTEMPILDGSAQPWCDLISQAGVQVQNRKVRQIQILQPVRVDAQHAWCGLEPDSQLVIHYDLHYDHAHIGHQTHELVITPHTFLQELASAKTFGFLHELEYLKSQGAAHGADLDNVVVFTHDHVQNAHMITHDDECVRHKMVDAVGDLMLAGAPILGKFTGYRSGHALNHALVRKLLHAPWSWCWV